MKSPFDQLTLTQSLQSLAMNSTITQQLEALAFEAFKNGDQQTANKILKLITETGNPVKVIAEVEKPLTSIPQQHIKSIQSKKPKPHSKEFWRLFLVKYYFPYLQQQQRSVFNRSNVEDYIVIETSFRFNADDLKLNTEGSPKWAKNLSNALQALKRDGYISNTRHGNTWRVNWDRF